jgi:hypothetical protein
MSHTNKTLWILDSGAAFYGITLTALTYLSFV